MDTDALDEFRAEVRAFIDDNLPDDVRERTRRGYWHASKADTVLWQKKLHRRGWAAPAWPKAYGGLEWPLAMRQILEDECGLANAPRVQPQGLKMLGPVLYTFGSEEQKARYLPKILSADEWWCQGYSEPGAGSDLANLSTRAVRQGDAFRLNGQKIWTSKADWADFMFCLARTSEAARRQDGISFLLLDMRTPGVVVRPITAIDGHQPFAEVFLDNVVVAAENLVGEEGKGWTYAKYLLERERLGVSDFGRLKERMRRLREGMAQAPAMGMTLAARVDAVEIDLMAAEATFARYARSGEATSAMASIVRYRCAEVEQDISALLVELAGASALRGEPGMPAGMCGPGSGLDDHLVGAVSEHLFLRAQSIGGGTTEIQKNIIAKSGLGL